MMDFSLIVPTRGRVEAVRALLSSIKKTTYDLNSIEVLLVCDDDDSEMDQAIKVLGDEYADIPLRFAIQPQDTKQWVETYFNKIFPLTEGRYIMPLPDDVLFMTDHWDKIILEKIKQYLADKPDGIVYGRTHTTDKKEESYFWYGKKEALWFEIDLKKQTVKPEMAGIRVTREKKAVRIKAEPIIWDDKEYRPLRLYEEFVDGTLIVIYGEKVPVRFTCFPVISRKAIDVLGHIFSPSTNAQGADFVIAKIYQDVDRVLDLPEISIQHLHIVDDAVHLNIEKMSSMTNWFVVADYVIRDVEKLKKHIELCKKR